MQTEDPQQNWTNFAVKIDATGKKGQHKLYRDCLVQRVTMETEITHTVLGLHVFNHISPLFIIIHSIISLLSILPPTILSFTHLSCDPPSMNHHAFIHPPKFCLLSSIYKTSQQTILPYYLTIYPYVCLINYWLPLISADLLTICFTLIGSSVTYYFDPKLKPWIFTNTCDVKLNDSSLHPQTVECMHAVLFLLYVIFSYGDCFTALHVFMNFSLITSWPSDPQSTCGSHGKALDWVLCSEPNAFPTL